MKRIKTIIIAIAAIVCCSCSNNDIEELNTPTFKVTSFEKELVNGIYQCKASIAITNVPEKYSIDGLIHADDITKIGHDLSYHENMLYDIHKREEGELYFNLYGKHKGNLTIELEWTSKENLSNYLIGWHLTYGFGDNCQVMMVDLEINNQ